jgi:hypothetical protein
MDLEGMLRLTESYGRANSVTFKSINQKNSIKVPPPDVERKEV